MTTRASLAPSERFWSKVSFSAGGCWEWTGGQVSGYGNFWLGGRTWIRAHRYAYEFCVGEIPNGLQLDHLCRNRVCVNPDHLEPVTQRENIVRGSAAITHCPAGHKYTDRDVTMVGWKRCLECHRLRENARYHAKANRNRRDPY